MMEKEWRNDRAVCSIGLHSGICGIWSCIWNPLDRGMRDVSGKRSYINLMLWGGQTVLI